MDIDTIVNNPSNKDFVPTIIRYKPAVVKPTKKRKIFEITKSESTTDES